ncbi:hypothetical protein BH20CHL7_BH20CHL7_03720 [soil metagenome]
MTSPDPLEHAPRARTPIRLAIIGAGWAGRRQAEAVQELDGRFEVVCFVDPDVEHAAGVARELGIATATDDLPGVLSDGTIDAVSICTPHRLHASMTVAAARHGKHVLVEKPMATTVAEGLEMLAAARSHGVRLVVAENQVYEAATQRLREVVSAPEALGNVAFASIVDGYRARDPRYAGRRDWLTDPAAGGTGTWMLQGIHTVARIRAIFGEISSVYVREHRTPTFRRDDLEATMSALLVTASGFSIWLVQTPEVALPARFMIQVFGDESTLIGDATGFETIEADGRRSDRHVFEPGPRSSYALELAAFAAEIHEAEIAPTTASSEIRSLAVVEAGHESARTNRPVEIRTRYPDLESESDKLDITATIKEMLP